MKRIVGELGERGCAPHQRGEVVDLPLVECTQGYELLAQHVERVARVAGRLDGACVHALHDHRRFQQIVTMLGEQLAPAGHADLVAGTADALQAASNRARRLDLHDEVDRTHVDAELQARRGDETLEPARLEVVFDLQPALARERPVVRSYDGGEWLTLRLQRVACRTARRRRCGPPSAAR